MYKQLIINSLGNEKMRIKAKGIKLAVYKK